MNKEPAPLRNHHKRDFFAPSPTIEELATEQGVEPAKDATALFGDFWPEDESTEAVLRTLQEWRQDSNPDG